MQKGKGKRLLLEAADSNNVELLKTLIEEGIDTTFDHDRPLRRAAAAGSVEALLLLMPTSSRLGRNIALHDSAHAGQTDCLNIILPEADPKYQSSDALRMATIKRHRDCVKVLLPYSDVEIVKSILSHEKRFDDLVFLDTCIQESFLRDKHQHSKQRLPNKGL